MLATAPRGCAGAILIRDTDGNTLGTHQRIDTTPRYDLSAFGHAQATDRFHMVIDGDLIAHRYLGDARLW